MAGWRGWLPQMNEMKQSGARLCSTNMPTNINVCDLRKEIMATITRMAVATLSI